MEKQTFVPKEFYCPITGELMINPMSDQNGKSYEKEIIIAHQGDLENILNGKPMQFNVS